MFADGFLGGLQSLTMPSTATSGVSGSHALDGSGWAVATGGSSGVSSAQDRTAPAGGIVGQVAGLPAWVLPVVVLLAGLAIAAAMKRKG
jgi:hypothetical protein